MGHCDEAVALLPAAYFASSMTSSPRFCAWDDDLISLLFALIDQFRQPPVRRRQLVVSVFGSSQTVSDAFLALLQALMIGGQIYFIQNQTKMNNEIAWPISVRLMFIRYPARRLH